MTSRASNSRGAILFSIAAAAWGCAAEATNPPKQETSATTGSTAATTGTGTGAGGAATTASSTGSSSSTGTTSSTTTGGGGGPGMCNVDAMAVISDFELGTAKENVVAGRDGSWFLYNDKTATGVQTPTKMASTPLAAEAPGACGSGFAFHTTAMGFTGFGAGAGVDFAPKTAAGGPTVVYDGTAYSGISLQAKAAAPILLRLSVSDANTDKEGIALGGTCVDTTDRTNPNRCGDYFGTNLNVTTDWQTFDIPFAMMGQNGWGMPVPTGIDKTRLFSLRLQAKGDFDLWIDNIAFLK